VDVPPIFFFACKKINPYALGVNPMLVRMAKYSDVALKDRDTYARGAAMYLLREYYVSVP